MKCASCGTELAEGTLLCPVCGRVLSSEEVAQSKAEGGKLSKKEFYKLPGMKSYRSNIISCAVVLYICVAVTILASVLIEGMGASIVDGILLLGLGIWLQIGKSRVSAIITTCYGLLSVGLVLVTAGRVQGWWIPLAGIWAIVYTFKFHNLWNKYQRDGVLPEEAVKK